MFHLTGETAGPKCFKILIYFRSCSQYLPGSVTTLTLSDNQILELGNYCKYIYIKK